MTMSLLDRGVSLTVGVVAGFKIPSKTAAATASANPDRVIAHLPSSPDPQIINTDSHGRFLRMRTLRWEPTSETVRSGALASRSNVRPLLHQELALLTYAKECNP